MTINIGWHFNGKVFLIADTALTHRGEPKTKTTSFAEAVVSEPSRTVEETLSKILPINTHAIAAINGNVAAATGFIDELRSEKCPNIAEAILSVADGRRTHEHAEFGLVVGVHDGKSTRLIQFESSKPSVITDILGLFDFPESACGAVDDASEDVESLVRRVAVVGSAGASLKSLVRLSVVVMAGQDADADRLLVGAVGFMQSQGLRNGLMDIGIGGAILGAFVDSRGVHWLSDVTYQIIDTLSGALPVDSPDDLCPGSGPLDRQPQRVSCAVRNGVAYVVSSYVPDQVTILKPSDWSVSSDEVPWAMLERLPLGDHPFFVLISNRTGDMMIVDRRQAKEMYIGVRPNGTYFASEEVVEFFSSPRRHGDPASIVFLPGAMVSTPEPRIPCLGRELRACECGSRPINVLPCAA